MASSCLKKLNSFINFPCLRVFVNYVKRALQRFIVISQQPGCWRFLLAKERKFSDNKACSTVLNQIFLIKSLKNGLKLDFMLYPGTETKSSKLLRGLFFDLARHDEGA